MRILALTLACLLPTSALAIGDESADPPKPTETSTKCEGAQVWDPVKQACVNPQGASLDNDTLFDAARELAYAGRPGDALAVLAAMTEGETDRVLTYRGFALRKAGDWEAGRAMYDRALAQNPDNFLARSYLGMGLVERGDMPAAMDQLFEIRARGGAGTRAEIELARALATSKAVNY
jgi:Flp pilus assembly protein TadD